jgi:hypothetical protein
MFKDRVWQAAIALALSVQRPVSRRKGDAALGEGPEQRDLAECAAQVRAA